MKEKRSACSNLNKLSAESIEFIFSYLSHYLSYCRIRIEDKIYIVNKVSKESLLIKVISSNLCKYENYAVCVYTTLGFFSY